MSYDPSLRLNYDSRGYLHIPQCFSPALIHEWADDLHWLVEMQLLRFGLCPSEELNPVSRLSRSLTALWKAYPEAQSWIYDEVNRRPWMYELASSKFLTGWVKELLGSNHIAIHPRLNMVMSMPRDEWHVAYWHQDRFYGPQNHVVSYIPLQDTGAFNGGLVVAPGAHQHGMLAHQYDDSKKNKWIALPEEVVSNLMTEQLNLSAGDLVLFDGLLPHSASINNSDEVRFAITIRYSNLTDPFFIERGWRWQDLAEAGLNALKSKEKSSHE